MCVVHIHQPNYMWMFQLPHDGDLIVQQVYVGDAQLLQPYHLYGEVFTLIVIASSLVDLPSIATPQQMLIVERISTYSLFAARMTLR